MNRQQLPEQYPELPGPGQLGVQGTASPSGGGGGGGGGGGKGTGQKPQYAKRGKITIVACVPCRKRKTKCDGKRPHCSQCLAREGQCHYDMTDDQRKLTYLRDNVEQLQEKSNSLQGLLSTVQQASEAEAAEIFRRIRQPGTDVQLVAEEIQAGQLLYGVARPAEQQGQLQISDTRTKAKQYDQLMNTLMTSDTDAIHTLIQRIRGGETVGAPIQAAFGLQPARPTHPQPLLGPQPDVSRSLEAAFSRHDQTFGMVKGAEMSHTSIGLGTEFVDQRIHHPWTNVTQDQELLEHLIDLYFTWQHCFFQNFPETLFRDDFHAGRTKFCSEILVNAICAAGCFLSNREIVRQDQGNGTTLLDKFYDEAKAQLGEASQSTLTTTASLYLISYVEGTRGHLSSLWMYSGRAVLMGVDLELHLRPTKKRKAQSAQTEEEEEERKKEGEARSHAFWGCFHVDQTTSFTLGRLPLLNMNGITCEPPSVMEMDDETPWTAYELNIPDRPGMRASTFAQCAALSKVVNSTLVMFFAPVVAMSGALLLAEYEKYLEWYRGLQPKIANTKNATPHVISLHMYYHTAILLLFRPFLKATIDYSDVVPREVCREAANMISDLWQEHKSLYGLSGIYMFQVHCLLTACTIHIINIPTISATRHLTQACNIFQELIPRNEWARSALVILRGLAEKWRLVLPLEVEEAMYRDIGGPGASNSETHGGSMLPAEANPDFARDYPQRPDPLSAQPNLVPNIDFRLQQQNQRNFLEQNPQYQQGSTGSGSASIPAKRASQDSSTDAQKRQRLLDPALRDAGMSQPSSIDQAALAFQIANQASMQQIPHPQPRQAQMVPQQQPQQQQQESTASLANIPVNFGSGFGMGLGGYSQRVQQQAVQQARSASSYIYSPLANQQPPLLTPIKSTSSRSEHGSESATTPGEGAVAVNTTGTRAPQQTTQQPQSAQPQSATSRTSGDDNPVKVEGLSFGDAVLDPFMGDSDWLN